MSNSEFLEESLKLLNHGENWIKGWLIQRQDARDCYCSMGAMDEVSRSKFGSTFSFPSVNLYPYFDDFATTNSEYNSITGEKSFTDFNDMPSTTWEDIEKMFNYAINRAKEEEAKNAGN